MQKPSPFRSSTQKTKSFLVRAQKPTNLGDPYKKHVNFDPHTKIKSFPARTQKSEVNFDHPHNKQVYQFQHKNQINFDPTLKRIYFWPLHKNQVNFDPHIEIKSIRSPTQKPSRFFRRGGGFQPSFSISAYTIPLSVSRLSRVYEYGMCRVSRVLCATCHAWSAFKVFFLSGVLGFVRERPSST